MNEMYLLLAVVTVLSSVLIPTIYLRIKEKQFFEELEGRFVECEINGYKTMDSTERQVLKEDYEFLRKRNIKMLSLIISISAIITGMPNLVQLIDIPLWLEKIYIIVVLILVAMLIAITVLSILEIYFEIFRTYKNKILLQYVYAYVEEDIWNIIVDTIVVKLTIGIIASIGISMFIGRTMAWPVENAYALCCIMLVMTNIIVTKNICRKQQKCLEQLILDEANI